MDATTIKTYTGLVGALCSHWATFEFTLVSVIWAFLNLDSATGKIVTGGLDIEGLLHYAEHVAMNAGTLWRDANLEQRLRLQRFWFPTGVTWSDGTVGTGVTSLFFSELATETRSDSGVATLAGFEPAIFTLKG